ncbi:MAG TPA: cytochrome c maturation protein CcmE [Candidatus Binataceae bacterium]|nr:cytochrome c maturation protein CcmE [Candidatus Binataceae bacterium]
MPRKLRFVIGVGLVMAAVAYLITTAIHSTSEYYLTVSEVRARETKLMGQTLRVAGRVKPGTIRWDPNTLTLKFTMMPLPRSESGAAVEPVTGSMPGSMPVLFDVVARGEPKPDMLAANRDVIVEGRLSTPSRLEASQVLTKCPSKYVPDKKG